MRALENEAQTREGDGQYAFIGKLKDGTRVYESENKTISVDDAKEEFKNRIATIFNLGAVELKTDTKKLLVRGDKFTVKKNVYGDDYAIDAEMEAKYRMLYDMADILSTATYMPSKTQPEASYINPSETPKNAAHKGVKYWYKFQNDIVLNGVGYTVTFNIRDKGKEQYQYLIDVKENGHPVSHTAIEGLRLAYRASTNTRLSQNDPRVNTQSMQNAPKNSSSGQLSFLPPEMAESGKPDVYQEHGERAAYLAEEGNTLDEGEQGPKKRQFYEKRERGTDANQSEAAVEKLKEHNETYTPVSNQETLEKAKEKLRNPEYSRNLQRRILKFNKNDMFNSVDVAAAEVMINDAFNDGNLDLYMKLIAGASRKGTELGRAVQAFAMQARLTPEGMLRAARRTTRKTENKMLFDGADEQLDIAAQKVVDTLEQMLKNGNIQPEQVLHILKNLDKIEVPEQISRAIKEAVTRSERKAKVDAAKKDKADSAADAWTLATEITEDAANDGLNDTDIRDYLTDLLGLQKITQKAPLSTLPTIREAETGGEKAADLIGSLLGNVALAGMMGVGNGATALGTKAAGGVAAKTGSQALGKIAGGAVDDVLLGLPLNVTQGIVAGDGDAGKTLKEIALGVGIDAASGGLLSGASHGLSKLADSKAAKSGLKTAAQTLDEIDEAYKTVAETAKNSQLDEILGPQNALTARPDFLDDVRAGVRSNGMTESEQDLLQALGSLQDGEMKTDLIRRLENRVGAHSARSELPDGRAVDSLLGGKNFAQQAAEELVEERKANIRYLSEGDLDAYLKAGGRANKKKAEALKEGKKILLTSKEEVEEYIGEAIKGNTSNPIAAYSKVSDRLAKDVYDYTGGDIDIADDYLELVSYDLKHAYDGHHTAKQSGDIDLTDEDFLNIPEYLDTYDELIYARRYEGGDQRVCVSKKIDNGRVVIIETVSNSRGSIQTKNIIGMTDQKYNKYFEQYNKSGNDSNSRGGRSLTDAPRDDVVSTDNIIPRSDTVVNNQFMQNAAENTQKNVSAGSTVEEVVADLGDAEAFHRGYMALNAPDMTPRITVNGKEWATDDYIRAVQQQLPDDPERLRMVVAQLEDAQAEQIAQAIRTGADEDTITSLPVNIQLFAAKEKLDYLELDAGEVGSKTRKFMEIRVPGRDNYTDKELADIVAGRSETYNPKSNEDLVKKAQKNLSTNKYRKQITSRVMSFDSADLFSDEEIAAVQLLMQEAEANGGLKLAANLRQGLSRKLTEAGCSVQAASLLGRLTPEGTLRSAENLLRKQADRKMYAGADDDLDDLVRKLTRKLQKLSNQPNLNKASMDELIDETAKRLNNNPLPLFKSASVAMRAAIENELGQQP